MIGKNKRLIYSRDASGASALHKAAKDGHIEVVKHILSENPESAKVTDDVSCLFSVYYSQNILQFKLPDDILITSSFVFCLMSST